MSKDGMNTGNNQNASNDFASTLDLDKLGDAGVVDVSDNNDDQNDDDQNDDDQNNDNSSNDQNNDQNNDDDSNNDDQNDDSDDNDQDDNDDSDDDSDDDSNNDNNEQPTGIQKVYDALEVSDEEDINIADYGNSYEDLAKLNKDVLNIRSKKVASEIVRNTFNQNEDLAKYYQHRIVEGKSIETFMMKHRVEDYNKIDTSNDDGRKQVISHYYKNVKNLDDNSITAIVKSIEDKGELDETSKSLIQEMDAVKAENLKYQEQQEVNAKIAQDQENEKLINNVNEIIKTGKLVDLKLKPREAEIFNDQLFTVDDHGRTLVQQKYESLSLEQQLLIDYLTLNVDSIKDIVSKNFSNKKKVTKDKLDNDFQDNQKRGSIKPNSNKGKSNNEPVSPLDLNVDLKSLLNKNK
jgi:hypothetical protein